MSTQKKFFIYFILLIAFFIVSKLLISGLIYTTYKHKSYEIKTTIPMTANVEATTLNGFVNGKIFNNSEEPITNKYIEVKCYSRVGTLMGKKYIPIDKIDSKSSIDYEVRFNFERVEKAVIDIVDEVPDGTSEEDKKSDNNMGLARFLFKLIIVF